MLGKKTGVVALTLTLVLAGWGSAVVQAQAPEGGIARGLFEQVDQLGQALFGGATKPEPRPRRAPREAPPVSPPRVSVDGYRSSTSAQHNPARHNSILESRPTPVRRPRPIVRGDAKQGSITNQYARGASGSSVSGSVSAGRGKAQGGRPGPAEYRVGENVQLPQMGTLLSVPKRRTPREDVAADTIHSTQPQGRVPAATTLSESRAGAVSEVATGRATPDSSGAYRIEDGTRMEVTPRTPTRAGGPHGYTPAASVNASKSLQDRLKSLQRGSSGRHTSEQTARPSPGSQQPGDPTGTNAPTGDSVVRQAPQRTLLPQRTTTADEPRRAVTADRPEAQADLGQTIPSRGGRPVITRRALPGLGSESDGVTSETAAAADSSATAAPSEVSPRREISHRDADATNQPGGVLFAQRSPVISVDTIGPRKIAVGKESAYQIRIRNTGEAADDVVVNILLPAWADVLGAEASVGATQLPSAAVADEPFLWRIGRLDANSQERLVLRIVPRESRPFDLAVRWNYKPVFQQAMIEVQEPRLAMSLEGPNEVVYGQRDLYKLRLSNTGNGPAENVMITLMPIGGGDNVPASHQIGSIQPNEEKVIEIELTARQTGHLTIQVEARGDNGVAAELAEKVLVRRAALVLNVDGPKVQFVGAVANYRVVVGNPGNAPARDVQVVAAIPAGAKYLEGIDGAKLHANGTKLAWTIDHLEPGAERQYRFQTTLGLPGASRLELLATAEDDVTASAQMTTRVEAMADLAMEVRDSTAPVAVGEDTIYELRVRNRGTKSAENVEIVAYFSRGIEPVAVEGAAHRIAAGQVVFSPIPSLPAGGERLIKIRARAEEPGNHIFRAECYCKPLGTRLVSEETTHFYTDGPLTANQPSVSPR